jgi:hypothetical protein
MTTETGKVRRLAEEIKELTHEIDRCPISDDAPLLYEEHNLELYGSPDHYGGDSYYLKHTGRDDLGTVLVKPHSPVHDALSVLADTNE